MKLKMHGIALCAAFAGIVGTAWGQQSPPPKGVYSFGADQTIADIGKMEWAPLKLEGLPAGIEIAVLRGDLAKGGGGRDIPTRSTRCVSRDLFLVRTDGSSARRNRRLMELLASSGA